MRNIEANVMRSWVASGAVVVTDVGEENTYAVDEFGYRYFAKLGGNGLLASAPCVCGHDKEGGAV